MQDVILTGKRLLDINHLARTRLHEPASMASRPVQPHRRRNLPRVSQVDLIRRRELHG